MLVGNCNAEGIKTIDIKINAPGVAGTNTYDFRFGVESEGLFGDTFQLTLLIVNDQVDSY